MAITPSTDPLYAWDVPGWTIQKGGSSATAGLNLEENPGVTASSLSGGSGAGLSGLVAVSSDPGTVQTDAALPATNVFYGTLVYLPEGAVTSKFVCAQTTAGTSTHAYGALLSTAGTTIAATADQTTALATAVWASSATFTLAPGFYYVGYAITWSVQPKLAGAPVSAVTMGASAANFTYSATATTQFPRYVTSSGTVTITSTFPTSVTLATQSSLGVATLGIL